MTRGVTGSGRQTLLGLGFRDIDRAKTDLASLGGHAEPLLALLGRTAEPDQALSALIRLTETAEREDLLRALIEDEGTAMRVLSCLLYTSDAADE